MFDIILYLFLAHLALGIVSSLIIIYLFFTDRIFAFVDRIKKHKKNNR